MSETKHTPGPWGGADHVEIVPLTGPSSHCTLAYMPEPGHWFTADEIKANSRLIAASPDLLEACKALAVETDRLARLIYGELHGDSAAIIWARAAIAKAEGNAAKPSRVQPGEPDPRD